MAQSIQTGARSLPPVAISVLASFAIAAFIPSSKNRFHERELAFHARDHAARPAEICVTGQPIGPPRGAEKPDSNIKY
jgi:hypothetical protein